MSRSIRFIPEGGALVEVTDRTVQARLLLVPSQELNEIVIGVLGRAQRLYKVRICGFVALSNHIHALLWVDDALQLVGYFASNLAREIARLTGWTDKIWARRYQAIVISDEEAAQISRLEYLLANGVKEGLVERVQDWPGVHCVRNLLDGEPLKGLWLDRTKEYCCTEPLWFVAKCASPARSVQPHCKLLVRIGWNLFWWANFEWRVGGLKSGTEST